MLSRSLTSFTNVSSGNDGMPLMWHTSACLLYSQFSQPALISFLYTVRALPRTIDHLASTDDGPLVYFTSASVMLSTFVERHVLHLSQYLRVGRLTGLLHIAHSFAFALRRLLNVAAQLLEQKQFVLLDKSRVCFLDFFPHCAHATIEENRPSFSCWLSEEHSELQKVGLLCLILDRTRPFRLEVSLLHLAQQRGMLSCDLNVDKKSLVKCRYCECISMIGLYNNRRKLGSVSL